MNLKVIRFWVQAVHVFLPAFLLLAPAAFASETFLVSSQSSNGLLLALSLPQSEPLANVKQGALVCGESSLVVNAAKLWLEESNDPRDGVRRDGQTGPAVSTRQIDERCFQVNEIFFPYGGKWQLAVSLAGGDSAVFSLPVAESATRTTYLAQGDANSSASLNFGGLVPTNRSTVATFCANEKSALSEVVLWMPDMGHGSSPTSVRALNPGRPGVLACSEIGAVDFFMGGKWEIRAKLANDESFVFSVLVSE